MRLKKAKEEEDEYKCIEYEVDDKEEEEEMVAEVVSKNEAGECFGLLLCFCFQCHHILTIIVASC